MVGGGRGVWRQQIMEKVTEPELGGLSFHPSSWLHSPGLWSLSLCPDEDYNQNNMNNGNNQVLQERADLAFTPGSHKVSANLLGFSKEKASLSFMMNARL